MRGNIITLQKTSIISDYTFDFQPIANENGLVKVINHFNDREQLVGLNINERAFESRVELQIPSVITDIIDLAVAIYACDRLIPLTSSHFNKTLYRLHLILPVRNPDLFNSELFQEKLNNLLIWTTGNQWVFEFKKRTVSGRSIEQKPIIFPTITQNSEVALWSGGLDSLAGAYNRLQENTDKSFILFGTGSNKKIFSDQKKIAEQVKLIFPNRINFLHIPINLYQSNEQPKNKLSRARGILFTLLGSACAYLMGRRQLFVYENGVGAINLPYTKATVGLDHSRSVHPQTLSMVSDLVSQVIGEKFEIKNPFLFSTKAQMCEVLAKHDRHDLVALTASCDRPHRKKIASQCGYCSSCLLRRQAIMVANLQDKTRYVITHSKEQSEEDLNKYFLAMQKQVNTFDKLLKKSLNKDMQWKYLTREFLKLDNIVDRTYDLNTVSLAHIRSNLIKLYENYVLEWKIVESDLEKGFLNRPLTTNNS